MLSKKPNKTIFLSQLPHQERKEYIKFLLNHKIQFTAKKRKKASERKITTANHQSILTALRIIEIQFRSKAIYQVREYMIIRKLFRNILNFITK